MIGPLIRARDASGTAVVAQWDAAQIGAIQKRLEGIKNGYPVAMQAAISDAMTTLKAQAARRIGAVVHLPIGDIKKTITTKRPSFRNLVGTMTLQRQYLSDGKPHTGVPLVRYLRTSQRMRLAGMFLGGKRPRGQLQVPVRKTGALAKYPTAIKKGFVGVMPSNSYIGVFRRTGEKRVMKQGRYKGRVREVIKRMFGPTPIGVFLHATGETGQIVLQETMRDAESIVLKNARSQVDRIVAGQNLGKFQRFMSAD